MTAAPARVSQLIKLALSTDKDGEAAAALSALRRTLDAGGIDLHQFADGAAASLVPSQEPKKPPRRSAASPPPVDWRGQATLCDRHRDELSTTECGLIDTLLRWRGTPTPKQLDWLLIIHQRITGGMG
jgi:hypothetical protein